VTVRVMETAQGLLPGPELTPQRRQRASHGAVMNPVVEREVY